MRAASIHSVGRCEGDTGRRAAEQLEHVLNAVVGMTVLIGRVFSTHAGNTSFADNVRVWK